MFDIKNKKIFLVTAIFTLSFIVNISAMHNPKSLKELAGNAAAKNISSISSLAIPEECKIFLGLIALQQADAEISVDTNSGGRIIDDLEYLDITAIDPFLNKSFQELMQEKNQEQLPFILAIVAIKKNGTLKHFYYDAHTVNKKLFGDDYAIRAEDKGPSNFSKLLSYTGTIKIESILLDQIDSIKYFIINSPYDIQAEFIGTLSDLQNEQKAYRDDVFAAPNVKQYIIKRFKTRFVNNFFLANVGNCDAQNELGNFYQNKDDLETAKLYYTLAADQGNPNAQNGLGTLYEKIGDFEMAKYYYSLAAAQSNKLAQYNLGRIYQDMEEDIDQAKNHYTLAANQKHIESQILLAIIYEKEGNLNQAKHYYKMAINQELTAFDIKQIKSDYNLAKGDTAVGESKNTTAPYNLALIYEKENKIKEAIYYYRISLYNAKCCLKFATFNNKNSEKDRQIITQCQFKLAKLYLKSGNTRLSAYFYNCIANKISIKQAKSYYIVNALHGDARAQCNLARIYEKEDDIKQAKHYYTLSASQGNAKAQNNLARIYESENNIKLAIYYYKLCLKNHKSQLKHSISPKADGKNQQIIAKLQLKLGKIYSSINRVTNAVKFLQLASSQYYCKANFKLAKLYEQIGDIKLSQYYYILAADKGHVKSQSKIEEFLRKKIE